MPLVPPDPDLSEPAALIADITNIVSINARRTMDEAVTVAAAVLRIDLDRCGVEADQEWCRDALETVRKGEPLIIDLDQNPPSQ